MTLSPIRPKIKNKFERLIVLKKSIKSSALCIFAVLLIVITAGCSDNSDKNTSSNTDKTIDTSVSAKSSAAETQSNTKQSNTNGEVVYDSKKAFKNIKIDDFFLPSPCTISDFPKKEYSVGMNLHTSGESSGSINLIGNLMHDEKKALSITAYYFEQDNAVTHDKDMYAEIGIISQTLDDYMSSHARLSVLGISVGDTIEDVKKTFGKPESMEMNNSKPFAYIYISDADPNRKIRIEFDGETVSQISIYYNTAEIG